MGLHKRPGSKYWYYSLQIAGKRVYKSTGETDRNRAKLVYLKSLPEFRDRELHGSPSKITLSEMIAIYLRDHSSRLTPRTHESNLNLKTRILRFFKPGAKLTSVTPHLVERYIASRSGRVRPATINRELTFLRGLFTRAIRWGYVTTSPMAVIKNLKEERKPERFLTDAEKDRLLATCRTDVRLIVRFALKTGMRVSELIHLQWSDVNLDTRRITVLRTKSHEARQIPLSTQSREILKRLPKRSGNVFTHEDGHIWARDNVWDLFKKACARAGLDSGFTFHDLRHTFARDLLDRGVDIYTVSKLLGHSVLTTTQRYLSRNMPRAQEAVEWLDRSATEASRANLPGLV